jgi:hypothetical protein
MLLHSCDKDLELLVGLFLELVDGPEAVLEGLRHEILVGYLRPLGDESDKLVGGKALDLVRAHEFPLDGFLLETVPVDLDLGVYDLRRIGLVKGFVRLDGLGGEIDYLADLYVLLEEVGVMENLHLAEHDSSFTGGPPF